MLPLMFLIVLNLMGPYWLVCLLSSNVSNNTVRSVVQEVVTPIVITPEVLIPTISINTPGIGRHLIFLSSYLGVCLSVWGTNHLWGSGLLIPSYGAMPTWAIFVPRWTTTQGQGVGVRHFLLPWSSSHGPVFSGLLSFLNALLHERLDVKSSVGCGRFPIGIYTMGNAEFYEVMQGELAIDLILAQDGIGPEVDQSSLPCIHSSMSLVESLNTILGPLNLALTLEQFEGPLRTSGGGASIHGSDFREDINDPNFVAYDYQAYLDAGGDPLF